MANGSRLNSNPILIILSSYAKNDGNAELDDYISPKPSFIPPPIAPLPNTSPNRLLPPPPPNKSFVEAATGAVGPPPKMSLRPPPVLETG